MCQVELELTSGGAVGTTLVLLDPVVLLLIVVRDGMRVLDGGTVPLLMVVRDGMRVLDGGTVPLLMVVRDGMRVLDGGTVGVELGMGPMIDRTTTLDTVNIILHHVCLYV